MTTQTKEQRRTPVLDVKQKRQTRFGIERVEGVKVSAGEVEAACKSLGIKYRAGDEDRVITFRASSEAQDSYGDVILQKGIDVSRFKKNPVILLNHDHHGEHTPVPIGVAVKVAKDPDLTVSVLYDEVAGEDEEPNQVARLVAGSVRRGFSRAVSIGFFPKRGKYRYIDSEADMDKYGMKSPGYVFEGVELLEVSNVTIPANAEALKLALGEDRVKIEDAAKVFGRSVEDLRAMLDCNPSDSEDDADMDAEIERRVRAEVFARIGDAVQLAISEVTAGIAAEVHARAGAVLSKANKEKLRQVKVLIDEVLSSAGDDEPMQDDKSIEAPDADAGTDTTISKQIDPHEATGGSITDNVRDQIAELYKSVVTDTTKD